MVDYTHYYGIFGDGHVRGRRGPGPQLIDPLVGQVLSVAYAPTPAPAVNDVVRGATSGVWGRIIRVLSSTSWLIEAWPATITVNALPGVPVPVTQPGGAFHPNELVNFDSGGSSNVMPFESFQSMPTTTQIVHELRDAALLTPTPPDRSDTVFWDRHAKYSRTVVLDGTTIAPGEVFTQGYRCTTSGGASFTILLGNVSGSDFQLQVVKVTGTLTVGHTVTNTTTGHTATIKSLGAVPPTGAWVAHDILPNNAGTSSLWEFPPNGNGTDGGDPSLGPEARFIRRAFEKHSASSSVADRGVRFIAFSNLDTMPPGPDAYLGGVTLQLVKCSGTFPGTWAVGETVTSGGWSGKLHGFDATKKFLYVYDVNGATLASGTVTGATSGASATCTGPALGWQPGSRFWNDALAEVTAAQSAQGALWMSSAAKWRGAFVQVWESELGLFGTAGGAAWPPSDRIQAQWVKFLTAFRTTILGDAEAPIALYRGDVRSRADDINVLGVPFAYVLVQVLDTIPKFLPKVRLVSCDGFEGAQSTALPYPTSVFLFRTLDYVEMGERAWRAIEFSNTPIPVGNFEPLPLILIAGQSQAVGGIQWQMLSMDRDPDLYSSALFTTQTGNTIDTSVLHFRADTLAWEPYDVYYANMFWGQGPGSFGMEAPLLQRMKRRFAIEPSTTAQIGIIKVAVGGASCNANSASAPFTFDPDASERVVSSATCTVTVIPATSLTPAMGRFTAAAGTFSSWEPFVQVTVAGSGLGFQTVGGNNSIPYRTNYCRAVAPDGSYVDLEGTFVAEASRPFTLTVGPYPVAPEVERVIRVAFEKCATQLRRIPKPVAKLWWNGESDLNLVNEYQAALTRTLEWMEAIFGQRHKGETPTATVIMELTPNTPWPVSDGDVATLIQAQRAVAASIPNATSVSTAKIPMETSGVWPRTQRSHNGVHHTARGMLMAGYMADEAFGTLTGIPPHPEGSAAVDFGTDGGGGVFFDGVDGLVGGGTELVGGETDAPGDLVVEDGTGRPDAESYASVDYADTFWGKRGSPTFWTGATLEQKEVALRAATQEGIDGLYNGMFRGQIQSQEQRLQFPRVGCYDDDGRQIASGTVPWRVLEATCLLAGEVRAGETLLPSEVERQITRETKKGAGFEKTTEYSQVGQAGSVKRRRAAEALLWPLFWSAEQGVTRA